MSITCAELLKRFSPLVGECIGDPNTSFTDISPVEKAHKGSLVFASTPQFLEMALQGPASIVVASKRWGPSRQAGTKTILLSPNAGVAQAKILASVNGRLPERRAFIHPTAQIAKTAKIGVDVFIGAFTVIGESCEIGDRAYIGAQCVIEDEAMIGADSALWGQDYIGERCRVGARCVLQPQVVLGGEGFGYATDDKGQHYRIPHGGIVVLEDDVEINSQCNIDRAVFQETRIGQGTKFDAHCHVGHNSTFGKNGIMVGGSLLGGSVKVGDNVFLSGGIMVADHVTITDRVSVSGLSGVTNDIEKPGQYGGYPLQPLKDHLRATATFMHLPKMRKNLNELVKKVLGRDE